LKLETFLGLSADQGSQKSSGIISKKVSASKFILPTIFSKVTVSYLVEVTLAVFF